MSEAPATPRRVAVFAGASGGADPAFVAAAHQLGAELAGRGLGLVFGGTGSGLMGAVADGATEAGGEAIGVMPGFLAEVAIAHPEVEIRLVDTLAERKLLMADLSAGFVALPGGLGTLDELVEMVTWSQLGVQDKPLVLLDVLGYWAKFEELLDSMVANGFLRPEGRALLRFESDPAAAVAAVEPK
ncbi:MAG TPA: TIGR00730 family Rossman fold protein [Solirubrobacterales bacterium]|nr:TIGR00730 family Rossman fold protein [Solirubrobacterales bacterium]